MSKLLSPFMLGDLTLRNRVVMAPLTRRRADNPERVPTALMVEYYAQRASAGLILSEATVVDPMGIGYPDTPGIWTDAQVDGWRRVVDAVHARGSKIFCQLWHVGRISHPTFLGGATPVAPSAVRAPGYLRHLLPLLEYPTPRALELEEIPAVVAAYERGAANAKAAGFDGVDVHCANGFLLDQFLQDRTNERDDAYGGPIENRARLLLEVVDAAVEVYGPNRVGVHLSPRCDSQDMGDSDRPATFTHVARALDARKIAFICTREHKAADSLTPLLRAAFGGAMIVNEHYDLDSAEAALELGEADAVAFGKAYIANPDLVERFIARAPLNRPDPDTFYRGGAKGYTDYPTLAESRAAQ